MFILGSRRSSFDTDRASYYSLWNGELARSRPNGCHPSRLYDSFHLSSNSFLLGCSMNQPMAFRSTNDQRRYNSVKSTLNAFGTSGSNHSYRKWHITKNGRYNILTYSLVTLFYWTIKTLYVGCRNWE